MDQPRAEGGAAAGRWSGVTAPTIRVAVHGDDHRRRAAATLLSASGGELRVVDPGGEPDVTILFDPAADAVRILAERPGAAGRIVVVAPDDRRPGELRRLLRAGADAVVFDAQAAACLPTTVRAVWSGQIVVPRALRRHVVSHPLSHREKEILRLVVRGLTNRQIADALYLAESTVKTHLSSAFSKLDAHSRAEVTELILDPDEGPALGIVEPGIEPGEAAARVA
jgi:DNA-binding NarL/FixJ family response regulator